MAKSLIIRNVDDGQRRSRGRAAAFYLGAGPACARVRQHPVEESQPGRAPSGRRPYLATTAEELTITKAPVGPTAENFRVALRARFADAVNADLPSVIVEAGEFHNDVCKQLDLHTNRMPVCCGVMQAERRSSDELLRSPPSGQGPSLTIRYNLAR